MSPRAICHLSLALVAGALLFVASPAVLGGSSTGPAASQPSMLQLFQSLSDASGQVRESAREQLMCLHAEELPALRDAVRASLPLGPGVREALQEIVMQVYLSGELADGDQEHGFMGVRMDLSQEPVYLEGNPDAAESIGVIVQARTPGFAAYRVLRNGDLILSIRTSDPADELAYPVDHPVHTSSAISEIVGAQPAGRKIELTLLRNGLRTQVSFLLGARPREIGEGNMQLYIEYMESQMQKALAFWNEKFALLVDQPFS